MDTNELRELVENRVWARCQIYGVLPGRYIRIHLVGLVESVSLGTTPENPLNVTLTVGYFVADQDWYREFWMGWPKDSPFRLTGHTDALRAHQIGPTRLALVVPGDETIVCVLFAENDDGRQEEIFPGFTFGPIDLDQIAKDITTTPDLQPEQPTGDTVA